MVELAVLVVVERLQPAEDLLDRHRALAGDVDPFLAAAELFDARAHQTQHRDLVTGHQQLEPELGRGGFGGRRGAGGEVDPLRVAELGIGQSESHLGEARRRLGDDAQPEILAANEGPGRLRAFELGVGVVGEVAVELARESEQRLERGAIERVGRREQSDRDAVRRGFGGAREGQGRWVGQRYRVERNRLAGVELLQPGDGGGDAVAGSECHPVHIGGDLFAPEHVEHLGVRG